jgi:hypothetical protein
VSRLRALWRWWRERQRLYREVEAFIGRKLPDFMSTETLRETMRLERQYRELMLDLKNALHPPGGPSA